MTEIEFYLEDLKSKFNKINPKDYYLSYSGGKDSHFLYWFLKTWLKDNDYNMWLEYRKIPVVAINTYMEFPEISDRMSKYADKILIPYMKPHEIIEKYGVPCFSKNDDQIIRSYQNGSRTKSIMRYINKESKDGKPTMYGLNKTVKNLLLNDKLPKISPKCCLYLKKKPAKKYEKSSSRKAIVGIMGSESIMRKSQYTSCFTKKRRFVPLFDANDKLIDKIYKKYNIELPNIYNYMSRTGCAGCPYGIYKKSTDISLALMTPAKRKYVMSLFKEAYDVRGVNYNQISIFDIE